MGSDGDSKLDKPRPFVEVAVSDGESRRFAAGTKASFALERINNSKIQEATDAGPRRYSHIESVKEGEGAVEFGPDAELVSYGGGWQLRAVREPDVLPHATVQSGASKPDTKDEIKAINRPQGKVILKGIVSSRVIRYAVQKESQSSHPTAATYPRQKHKKKLNLADFFPEGAGLPDSGPPEDLMTYFRNIILIVLGIFSFGTILVYLLENQFFMGAAE